MKFSRIRSACFCLLCLLVLAAAGPARAAAEPPNAPAELIESPDGGIQLDYHGAGIISASFYCEGSRTPLLRDGLEISSETEGEQRITQRISISLAGEGGPLVMEGMITAGPESFPAETGSAAQTRFPLVRNSAGLSRSLRNNAVYDRGFDWVLEGPEDVTRIIPVAGEGRGRRFRIRTTGASIELVFRPRFYQRHKGIKYFRPWEYEVKRTSVTGWCSWWAYMKEFDEATLDQLLAVWVDQRLVDFGYNFIQIDDTFQQPVAGPPKNWLEWNHKFPGGMRGYADKVRAIGGGPGIWVNSSFGDEGFVNSHPDWFLPDAEGRPFRAPWVGYTMDATSPEVADTLIRPLYRGIRENGFTYVKIDGLRHYLFDGLRNMPGFAQGKGMASADILRAYLSLAREELGPDTFVLGCWGVLPEAAGIVDSIRLGGDGFGPATLQQYNSWNGVVWRNDPDHCDLRPSLNMNVVKKWKNLFNRLLEPKKLKAPPPESIIRPTIASMAGAVLLLSDRAEVYRDPMNIEGAKRASPVLFTVPGQLYDYDPSRTDQVRDLDPDTITAGKYPSPYDARQTGDVAQWWMLEIDRPFEYWTVLARFNWTGALKAAIAVKFADLGLDPDLEYLVYEFWTREFLGKASGTFQAPAIGPMGTHVFVIRELLDRPQVLSTSRHISQGGVDLEEVSWDGTGRVLSGKSRVVAGDRYELSLHLPDGFIARRASFSGVPSRIVTEGPICRIFIVPESTGLLEWQVEF